MKRQNPTSLPGQPDIFVCVWRVLRDDAENTQENLSG